MIKAVIFDMDGLIIDSEPLHSKSLEILLKKYGKTPKYHKNGLIHRVGLSGDEEYIKLLEKYELQEEKELFRKKRRRIYVKLLNEKLEPMPGFLPLMKILQRKGIQLGVASNRFVGHIKLILKKFEVIELFGVIVGANKKIPHKPAPDTYLRAARKLKVDPKECVALEDSETGVTSAKGAGMKVIAVPNKYTKSHNFSKADLIVNSLKEIKWSTILNI